MAKRSVAFLAFLLLLFVLAISEFATVKGELCERASKTWSGKCSNTGKCDGQCQSWENAAHGACHTRGGKKMCFCYFTCSKAEKMAQDKQKAKDEIEAQKPPHLEHPVGPIHP